MLVCGLSAVSSVHIHKGKELLQNANNNYVQAEANLVLGTQLEARIGLDLKDETRLRVNLESQDDALYVGTLYMGAPHGMPARVIFDTGSEHLAITGALCNNKTAGDYRFNKESQFSKTINLEVVEKVEKPDEEKPKTEEKPDDTTDLMDDDQQAGDDEESDEDEAQSDLAQRGEHRPRENRCHTKAYDMHNSTSGFSLQNTSTSVLYGSAQLTGFLWKDYSCLQPLELRGDVINQTNSTYMANLRNENARDFTVANQKQKLVQAEAFQKEHKCSFFQFLTLYKGHGLGKEADGILGLAPQKSVVDREKNYIWSLYNNGIITKPILSFSMASSEQDDQPYALFGGYNSSQIVGGEQGLQTFKNNPGNYKSNIRSWAMDTKDILYDGQSLQYSEQTKTYPAVIDTGSSFLAVPPEQYHVLQDQWRRDLSDLDCKSDATFCQSRKSCTEVAKLVKPVGFQIGETIFDLSPSAYLHQGEAICQFAIAENPLDQHNNGNFLFGDLFLKHFYSIYDYDQELISLGVNTHSKSLVQMYPRGQKGQPFNVSEPEQDQTVTSAYSTASQSEMLAGKAAPEGVKQLSGKGVDQQHTEFENDSGVQRGNAPKEEPEKEEAPLKVKKEEKPKENKPKEKKQPVILEITQDKKEQEQDGGVQRGNAPKQEFSGPPDQGDKDEEKPKEAVKTEVIPSAKSPQPKNEQNASQQTQKKTQDQQESKQPKFYNTTGEIIHMKKAETQNTHQDITNSKQPQQVSQQQATPKTNPTNQTLAQKQEVTKPQTQDEAPPQANKTVQTDEEDSAYEYDEFGHPIEHKSLTQKKDDEDSNTNQDKSQENTDKKETTLNKNQDDIQNKQQNKPQEQSKEDEKEKLAKEKSDLLAKLEAIRAQREKVQNEVKTLPFPPVNVSQQAEDDAPHKSALEQQMENAWNNDDDKDMEALAKETAKKSSLNKPKSDARVQLDQELFMR